MTKNVSLQDASSNFGNLASRIGLLLNASISCLITEGPTDQKFYKGLVIRGECQVFCPDQQGMGNGKAKALELLQILESRNLNGMLAIVDADFEILDGKSPTSLNLFYTDSHDLETMLINSPALDKILDKYGSEQKLVKFPAGVRVLLIESARHLGYLRWASLKHNLSLRFEGLSFEKFVIGDTLEIDVAKLITTIKNHSKKLALRDADIMQLMNDLKNDTHDIWHICCGHDLASILALGLHKTLGSLDKGQIKPERLEEDLRLAYEQAYFRSTQLYKSIREWEKRNKPFQVIAASVGTDVF